MHTTDSLPGGALVVSLDFELFWGMRDRRTLDRSRDGLARTREVVPRLLDTFRRHDVHATWATVGLLFCDGRAEALEASPRRKPTYADPNLSPYPFIASVEERDAEVLFAPDLVQRILETPGQELATHTFSHYYCLEPGQTAEQFREDVLAAQRLARAKFGRTLESLVFPRNQAGADAIAALKGTGILCYRGNQTAWCYRPRNRTRDASLARAARLLDTYLDVSGPNTYRLPAPEEAPTNLPASRFLRPCSPRLRHLEPLRLRRITRAMEAAARKGEVFHLWWHPENFAAHPEENFGFLERVLDAFDELHGRRGMRSLTMAEAARERLHQSPAGDLSR